MIKRNYNKEQKIFGLIIDYGRIDNSIIDELNEDDIRTSLIQTHELLREIRRTLIKKWKYPTESQ